MAKSALKLVKTKKKSMTIQKHKLNGKSDHISHRSAERSRRSPTSQPSTLTPAECAEAVRFRALTKQRAARQAKVRRIVAKLNELDRRTPNAA